MHSDTKKMPIKYPNTGRQIEVDIAKAFAMFFMIFVHVGEYYYNGESRWAELVVAFLGSPPTAPIFMMALGIGAVYSRMSSASELLKRGISLFIFSYIFNAVVYALPYILISDFEYAKTEFLDVDILQFAGLTFIFLSIIKHFNLTWKSAFSITLVMQAANELLHRAEIVSSNYVISRIQGLFWWTSEDSYFPFFLGYAFR